MKKSAFLEGLIAAKDRVGFIHMSEKEGVIRLIGHLNNAEGTPTNVDLTQANPVTLWYLKKSKEYKGPVVYEIWTPYSRKSPMWARGPAEYILNRTNTVEVLKSLWIQDAMDWLKGLNSGN